MPESLPRKPLPLAANPLTTPKAPEAVGKGRKKKKDHAPPNNPFAPATNPILQDGRVQTVRIADVVTAPTSLTRAKRSAKREIRELRTKQSAATAIEGLHRANEIYGFTKGQFTLLDLWQAVLAITGPAHLTISTWTAARNEIRVVENLFIEHRLLGTRWLIDATFGRRDPEACAYIKQVFGPECMRIANNHANFAVFVNESWQIVLRTSMNLNMNPRFEDFTIAHDPELAAFILTIIDQIWTKQKTSLAVEATATEMDLYFREEM